MESSRVELSLLRANGNGCGVGFVYLWLSYAWIFCWIKRRTRGGRGEESWKRSIIICLLVGSREGGKSIALVYHVHEILEYKG